MYIIITIRKDCSLFASGLRQHLSFVLTQFTTLGYSIAFIGQNNDYIDGFKKQLPVYEQSTFLNYNNLQQFLKNNHTSIAFLLGWEVYLGEHNTRLLKKFNIPIIQSSCGNLHIPLSLSFNDNKNDLIHKYPNYDLLLSFPHHYKTHYLRPHLYPQRNITIPYVWSHIHLGSPIIQYEEKQFKHIYILEANFNQVKNCFVPLIALIHTYNTTPSLLKSINIHFLCSLKVKDSILFLIQHSCKDPDGFKSKITINSRLSIRDLIIKRHHKEPAIILSHQYQNELNYLYFDCLYSNIPIIHNSTMINECGYFYKDNDIPTIYSFIQKLLQGGIDYHIQYTQSQQSKIQHLFHTLNPLNKQTMEYMKQLCDSICSKKFDTIQSQTNFGPLKNMN